MLRRIADEGLRARYGDPAPAEAVERLEFELGVIEEMGFSSYFLIVWDFVRYAKENGVAVGPGRGSAAGSIVSYVLNITDLDPLADDLIFERFLNPGRKSMPDIDIDFSVRGRERMIRYVAEKYGRESVAQIITFGKMAPRAATRDAARVLGYDYGTGDRLAKLIPEPIMGRSPSFAECLKTGQELQTDLRRRAGREEDHRRRPGPRGDHPQQLDPRRRGGDRRPAAARGGAAAAGRGPQRPGGSANGSGKAERQYKIVTQYSMGPIEEIGLLKMDFLGLRNLDVIEDAIDIIRRSRGEEIDMEQIPIDDAKTYEMLAERRLDRRLPVRVRGHARRAAQGEADRVRRPGRARRPLPARARWPTSPPTPRARRTRRRSATRTRACARSPRRPTAASSTRSS